MLLPKRERTIGRLVSRVNLPLERKARNVILRNDGIRKGGSLVISWFKSSSVDEVGLLLLSRIAFSIPFGPASFVFRWLPFPVTALYLEVFAQTGSTTVNRVYYYNGTVKCDDERHLMEESLD